MPVILVGALVFFSVADTYPDIFIFTNEGQAPGFILGMGHLSSLCCLLALSSPCSLSLSLGLLPHLSVIVSEHFFVSFSYKYVFDFFVKSIECLNPPFVFLRKHFRKTKPFPSGLTPIHFFSRPPPIQFQFIGGVILIRRYPPPVWSKLDHSRWKDGSQAFRLPLYNLDR